MANRPQEQVRGEGYLYEEIAQKFMRQIELGGLRPGEKLPSVRQLQAKLDVSPATVLQAYWLLESRNYIEARPQSGFYVSDGYRGLSPEPETSRPDLFARRVDIGRLAVAEFEAAGDPRLADLASARPGSALLPVKQLARLGAKICRTRSAEVISYSTPLGYAPLRKQLARRSIEWGGSLLPVEVVTVHGGMEALTLCLRAAAKPGAVIAVESPTYYGVLQIIESLGMLALEIPTHPKHGLSLPALYAAAKKHRIDACLFIPSFNNPLGSLMPDENKKELAAFVAKHSIPLIEDDICGELYFGHARPKTVKTYDRSGLVMLCSSFSKTVAPGYRVGWIAPGKFLEKVKQLRLMSSLVTVTLPQIVLADFMGTPGYDRHLRNLRRTLAVHCSSAAAAAARSFPRGTRISRPQGGIALWVELPARVNAASLKAAAFERGINFLPGLMFSAGKMYRNCLRLAYGQVWSPRIERAVATLGELATAK